MRKPLSERIGAKCPAYACNERWKWDWEDGTLRNVKDGETAVETILFSENSDSKEKEIKVSALRCKCGALLLVHITDQRWGAKSFYPPLWEIIDWTNDRNAWR